MVAEPLVSPPVAAPKSVENAPQVTVPKVTTEDVEVRPEGGPKAAPEGASSGLQSGSTSTGGAASSPAPGGVKGKWLESMLAKLYKQQQLGTYEWVDASFAVGHFALPMNWLLAVKLKADERVKTHRVRPGGPVPVCG